MPLVGPGEITHLENSFISQEETEFLGSWFTRKVSERDEDPNYRYLLGQKDSYGVIGIEGEEILTVLGALIQRQEGALLIPGNPIVYRNLWLIAGAQGMYIPWHLDSPGDVRVMTNLGAHDATLEVATEWSDDEYFSGLPIEAEPPSFKALTFSPGESYVINNLCDVTMMSPHQTPPDPNRLVLRASFMPEFDYKEIRPESGLYVAIRQPE